MGVQRECWGLEKCSLVSAFRTAMGGSLLRNPRHGPINVCASTRMTERKKEGNSSCSNSRKRHLHLDGHYRKKKEIEKGLEQGFIQMPRSLQSVNYFTYSALVDDGDFEDKQGKGRTPTLSISRRLGLVI